MTRLCKNLLLIPIVMISSFCQAKEVIITQNPFNRIAYTQDANNVYFTIEILDSALIKGRYPVTDFASIDVDKNKNNKVDEYLDTAYGIGDKEICGQYLISERASTTCEKLATRATVKAYTGTTSYSKNTHSIVEYKIPKNELSFDDESAAVVFTVYSAKSKYKNFPSNTYGKFTSTINISLHERLSNHQINEQPSNFRNMLISKPISEPEGELADLRNMEIVTPSKNKKHTSISKSIDPNKLLELKGFKVKSDSDCKAWINSNIIDPSPDKKEYIKENCQ